MNKKEMREYKKDMCINAIEEMIQGKKEKLEPKNKKLLKDFIGKELDICLYTLGYVKDEYYSWEVDPRDYNINSNFDRLIYLLNNSYDYCSEIMSRENVETKDYDVNLKKFSNDLKNYEDIAKKVGL